MAWFMFVMIIITRFKTLEWSITETIITKIFRLIHTHYVLVLPRISPFNFDSPIFAGQSAQATCFISEGDLPLDISWIFNGHTDLFKYGINTLKAGTKTSFITIDSTSAKHSGQYTCTVKNPAGVVSYMADLEVRGNKSM